MAAKPVDPDLAFLSDLADHAHRLINEFISLSASERERSVDLLFEIQHVLSEFKRLRPPPTFRTLRLVRHKPCCEICGKPVDPDSADVTRTMRTRYHLSCLEDREPE